MSDYSAIWFDWIDENVTDFYTYILTFKHYDLNTMSFESMQESLSFYNVKNAIDLAFTTFGTIVTILFLAYFVNLSIDFIKKV